jgi:DNA gyrase/topoisomerase IV subunit A
LQISQFLDEDTGDVDYRPKVEGPESFLKGWVKWRRGIVVGAAKHRAVVLRTEAAHIDLLLRVVALRKELDKIRDSSKDRDEIRRKTRQLLKCTEDEARTVMDIAWPRLAVLEAPPLREKKGACLKQALREDATAARPATRMEDDVSASLAAITASRELVKKESNDDNRNRKTRSRRAAA